MKKEIILTTGIYDLIKDHIRRRKVTKEQEDILTEELRFAKQILRRELPEDVVTVNKKLKYKIKNQDQEFEILLVGPKKAKPKKNKISILSEVGLATVGRKVGEIVTWPTQEGTLEYEILNVSE